METPIASVRLRLPIPMGVTLGIGLGIIFCYIITLVLVFAFQDSIEHVIGVNPAHSSIIMLMVILFIPWAIIAWLLLKNKSKIGLLNLYTDYLTITDGDKIVKEYNANAINSVKIQGSAIHFDFKDGYRFNILNVAMGPNYNNELIAFNSPLLAFLNKNNVSIIGGRIL